MPGKAAPKRETRVVVSADARQLLALMAERSGLSPSAVLELAIREKAQRERIDLESSATTLSAKDTPERQEAARNRFRHLMESARVGFDDLTPEEVEQEVQRSVIEVRESRRAGHD